MKTKKKWWLAAALILLIILAAISIDTNGIPVLNYHQINNRDHNALTVSTEQFAAQMQYLEDAGYHTITAGELADALSGKTSLPDKPILITFDDGYRDNYKNAFPILQEHHMKAMVFLISDYVSTYPNYLTWGETLEMQEHGIEFGSHTLNHVELNKLSSTDEMLHQLKNSKEAIEWRLGTSVNFLAYPCGSYNDEVLAATQDAGYRAAFTVQYGVDVPGADLYSLNRIPVFGGNSHTLLRFKLRLRCPVLFATLGHWKKELTAAGHTSLANLVIIP
jgi:peptidoglycan/xylan/chitin deacetylase (PgdA/CDA1 family)